MSKLVHEVLDHFKIVPSQLMLNMWRLLMLLECLSLRYEVEVRLGEVLYSYYLKEHDKENGRYYFTLRRERSHLIACLWLNI